MSTNKAKIRLDKKKSVSSKKYESSMIESKWQRIWEEESIYQPDMKSAKRPFYNLMMFPYPSAEGLHVGSVFAFSGVDIYGRFKRMQGNDVFEPIGLDGFGIHSENHAIKTGTHPMDHAKRTEENFYRQLRSIGNGFDWRHKVETYDPDYYRWTQWLFVELFKAGLAYRKKSPVNYCPSCKTVLSDEQVIEKSKVKKEEVFIEEKVKVCERCDTEIEIRELEQWFFRITKYADRLLANIDKLNWAEKVKIAQRNWIGKSEGSLVKFLISNFQFPMKSQFSNSKQDIEVFTTRPDTLFGATFLVLSPEHPLITSLSNKEVKDYIKSIKGKSDQDRIAAGKEKTGVFSGLYAINPVNQEKIPIWIADYVLMGYGTGAIMAVPAHDKRDFEFAQKFGLEIKRVVVGKDGDTSLITRVKQVQEEEGKMINSGFLDGVSINEATEKIMDYMEEKGWGKRETTYHLRDWLISRQRYWGPPIPMIYCESCALNGDSWFTTSEAKEQQRSKIKDQRSKTNENLKFKIENSAHNMRGWYPVEEKDLPVELPYVEDYKPMGTGKAPLANYPDFYETRCPVCGHSAKRETDVSDTFLDSSWYFLRYLATDWNEVPFPSVEYLKIKNQKSKIKNEIENLKLKIESSAIRARWLPVNMYIGGAEHSVLHLLYARFVTMVLCDLGYISFEEPFARFYAHGLIIKDGAKMSKSRGNVINPDEYIRKLGADTLRMYLHFLGPFDKGGDFRDTGIEGMHKFLKRVYTLFKKSQKSKVKSQKLNDESLRMMHGTIKGITDDMENLRYNTAIAKLMGYYNFLVKQEIVSSEEASVYLRLLAPFAPHMAEDLWQKFQVQSSKFKVDKFNSIHLQSWPSYDFRFIGEEMVTIPVQINGKLRDTLKDQRSKIKDQKYVEKMAKESGNVRKYLEGKRICKVIYIPGKVINFVIN